MTDRRSTYETPIGTGPQYIYPDRRLQVSLELSFLELGQIKRESDQSMFRSDRDDLTCPADREITSPSSHLVQHEDELIDIGGFKRFSHEIEICRCREIGG
jgi:hypothetical protein